MVTKVIIQYKSQEQVVNANNTLLSDFCVSFSYKSEEGVNKDTGVLTLVFESFELANSFYIVPGVTYLISYGITGNLAPTRTLVVDTIDKIVDKRGITFQVNLIPLVDYLDNQNEVSTDNPWDKFKQMADELHLEFSLPENFDFYWEKRETPTKKSNKVGSTAKSPLENNPWAWNTQAGGAMAYTPQNTGELERYYDGLFDSVAFAGSILKQLEESVSRYEALMVDSHDDQIVVKERGLTEKPRFSIDATSMLNTTKITNVVSYEFTHSDKAVKSEAMVQATIDMETKELGITKVSSLPDNLVEIPIYHIGDGAYYNQNKDRGKTPGESVMFKVLSDGESFYVQADDEEEFVRKLKGEEVEFVKQQINAFWDKAVSRGTFLESTNPKLALKTYTNLSKEQITVYETVIKSQLKVTVGEELGYDPGFDPNRGYEPDSFSLETHAVDQADLMVVDGIKGHKYEDPQFPPITNITGLNRFMAVYGRGFEGTVSESESREILASRVENLVNTSFPYTRGELLGSMVKDTIEEALNKKKLSVTLEGTPGFITGAVLFFKSKLQGESGRFYITQVEDTVTSKGFFTKVEGLKVPKQLSQNKEQYVKNPDEAWETLIDGVTNRLIEESDDLITNTLIASEEQDLSQVPLIDVKLVKGDQEIEDAKLIGPPKLKTIRNLPKK